MIYTKTNVGRYLATNTKQNYTKNTITALQAILNQADQTVTNICEEYAITRSLFYRTKLQFKNEIKEMQNCIS